MMKNAVKTGWWSTYPLTTLFIAICCLESILYCNGKLWWLSALQPSFFVKQFCNSVSESLDEAKSRSRLKFIRSFTTSRNHILCLRIRAQLSPKHIYIIVILLYTYIALFLQLKIWASCTGNINSSQPLVNI
jgi:hypothetical protein